MAGGGVCLFCLGVLGLWFSRKKKELCLDQRWLCYILGLSLWLPFIIKLAGWFILELGRYPWVFTGCTTMSDAVSPTTTAGQCLFTNICTFCILLLLGGE